MHEGSRPNQPVGRAARPARKIGRNRALHLASVRCRRTPGLVEYVVMDCPRCHRPTRVLESRRADGGAAVRRRRECPACAHRFTTFERSDAGPLFVRKRHGGRQRFQRAKLRAALLRATHKRQVSADDVEALVDRVELAIEAAGGELSAARIGAQCLAGLESLDRGAYLQFLGTLPAANADIAGSAEGGSVRAERKSASLPVQTRS
ncbi:MAG: transcriptional repressor NrdR [Solirubrobacterales bacterium]|nr:transcriptional repressor NrdR [Solirubrobacterales bacterium]